MLGNISVNFRVILGMQMNCIVNNCLKINTNQSGAGGARRSNEERSLSCSEEDWRSQQGVKASGADLPEEGKNNFNSFIQKLTISICEDAQIVVLDKQGPTERCSE